MLPPPGEASAGRVYFEADVKCCGYFPRLPSFLVGAILADDAAAEGRRRVRERIAQRAGVTPWGVVAPRGYQRLARDALDSFGRVRSLVCPYFEARGGGKCTIWQHRNGVCRGWHCKHERGAVGHAFWGSVTAFFTELEDALAHHCALTLDLGPRALELLHARVPAHQLEVEDLDARVDDDVHAARWGRWAGREEAFFIEAARLVAPLDATQALAIAGAKVASGAAALRSRHADLVAPRIPARLRLAPLTSTAVGRKATTVVTYSECDGLDLPNKLLLALSEFDGQATTATARRRVAQRHDLTLDDATVQQLVDHEILVDATDEG
jgi:hypothetical protein